MFYSTGESRKYFGFTWQNLQRAQLCPESRMLAQTIHRQWEEPYPTKILLTKTNDGHDLSILYSGIKLVIT